MNGREIDRAAAMLHLALGQAVPHKHRLDRLHVIFSGQIHHRHIFVVELAMLFRRIAVARDEMVEHIDMGVDMAIEVHRHEARQLQESGIDEPPEAGMGKRHPMQAIVAKPFDAAPLGERD